MKIHVCVILYKIWPIIGRPLELRRMIVVHSHDAHVEDDVAELDANSNLN